VNPSEIFIKRPIATSLLMLALAFFGVVAYRLLQVADLPSVEFPTISVTASVPGADPGTMSSAVAGPLERQFTTIAGLDSMTSSSSAGATTITLQFDLNRDIDGAAIDVQTAISEVMPLLPAGMPSPPSFRKVNPADQAVMQIGVISPTLQPSEINFYNESLLAPQMSMVNGVAQVSNFTYWRYAVRVQVDPEKLQAYQIGINEVDQALQN
jgi:hydrophobic/amphiphilic exporter-1 (mainly G- bacteria), HAE1 family